MSERVKLRVTSTASLALQWGVRVVRRHWVLVLAYALVPFAFILIAQRVFPVTLTVGRNVDPRPFLVFFGAAQLYAASLVFLALVTHNEVLRGTAGFDAATMGRGGGRAFSYIFDFLVIALGGMIIFLGIIVGVGKLVGLGSRPPGPEGLVLFGFIGLWLAMVLAINRLMLRLPSRALGQPLPWGEVWRLGRGNSWRLLGCLLLVSMAVGIAMGAIMLPLQLAFMPLIPPPGPAAAVEVFPALPFASPDTPFMVMALLSLLMGLSYPVNTILLCAFLSVAYVELRDGVPDAAPPAQRIEPIL